MATLTAVPVPLESGDRLTREEFHRRYCARPDIRKAELIQGVVYVASPVSDAHSDPHAAAIPWLGVYAANTPGVLVRDNGTVILGPKDEVQPDIFLFRDPPPPGGARRNEEKYIEGPPQLVMEIAASSVSKDLHDKKESYRQAGVPEYVVWRSLDGAIDWFRLQGGEYVRVEPDELGIIESSEFPGLRLDVNKMLAGDLAGVLKTLQRRPRRRPR